tara:strand:+ start:500 stop:748 length:249 start_codon:yes stop_codon:yes gene_type:complete
MQKIVNIISIASGVVSLAVVGTGLYVYVNRGAIIDNVKSQAIEAALGSLGGAVGGALPDVTGGVVPKAAPAEAPSGLAVPKF